MCKYSYCFACWTVRSYYGLMRTNIVVFAKETLIGCWQTDQALAISYGDKSRMINRRNGRNIENEKGDRDRDRNWMSMRNAWRLYSFNFNNVNIYYVIENKTTQTNRQTDKPKKRQSQNSNSNISISVQVCQIMKNSSLCGILLILHFISRFWFWFQYLWPEEY